MTYGEDWDRYGQDCESGGCRVSCLHYSNPRKVVRKLCRGEAIQWDPLQFPGTLDN